MDPVHKISIVQRGFGALGYTMQLPLEDRYLMQRRDLLNQLAVLLGGRTAEEIALGEISTGAQNDLQRATDIARAMVTEWGMSDALGAINYDGHKRSQFLDIPLGPERGAYAEDTARLIDAEVKRIMTDAHDEARRILGEKRDMLETRHAAAARNRGHGRRRAAPAARRPACRPSLGRVHSAAARRMGGRRDAKNLAQLVAFHHFDFQQAARDALEHRRDGSVRMRRASSCASVMMRLTSASIRRAVSSA